MRRLPFLVLILAFSAARAQRDTTGLTALSKETTLSEVVIRSDLNVLKFLDRVKNDTSFYKAFRNLHVIGFTSLNDIKMLDGDGKVQASLYSKTRQNHTGSCRTMDVLEQKTTGDMYDGNQLNYYTANLYASLFFTNGQVCNETNIVAGTTRDVRGKSGIEKHKEQLKMLFFDPGKKIPGIPFIGDKVAVFDPESFRYYDYALDMEDFNGRYCYVFRIAPRADLSSADRDHIVFDNITTWFDPKTMEIVARNYDLSYSTPVYDFNVHMEVQMTHFGQLLVPSVLRYKGEWKVLFKKRERGVFTATLFDFK
jgi:hypothetical protein